MGSPLVRSRLSSIKPSASSDNPISFAEQHMPKDSTPRSFDFLIVNSGNFVPISAHGTLMPALALGAPQTICSFSEPTST